MAADRQRLAAALAYEQQRRRMMESVPTTDNLPPARPARSDLRTDLENLSSGIGQGIVNQMEGVKGLITDPVGTVKGAYEGVKGIVRDPSVLADALRYTADKAMSGPLGAGEVVGEMLGPMRGKPPMAEIDVYHGSPHRFEEFDASKIGTGEGAQAYGHGIYLAESPGVAKSYQTALTHSDDYVDGQLLDSSIPNHLLARVLSEESNNIDNARDSLTALTRPGGSKSVADSAKQALKLLDAGERPVLQTIKPKGSFYTADLPDEMVDRMLDWDKPLSKDAPQAVKDAFNKLAQTYPKLKEKLFSAYREGKPGSHYYSLLNDYAKTGDLVKNQTFASDAMRQAGIPGIRYLDAGSRGQGGSGTRNFVVFPGEEKKVKILKRE